MLYSKIRDLPTEACLATKKYHYSCFYNDIFKIFLYVTIKFYYIKIKKILRIFSGRVR